MMKEWIKENVTTIVIYGYIALVVAGNIAAWVDIIRGRKVKDNEVDS